MIDQENIDTNKQVNLSQDDDYDLGISKNSSGYDGATKRRKLRRLAQETDED
jgi:hypothetical protein